MKSVNLAAMLAKVWDAAVADDRETAWDAMREVAMAFGMYGIDVALRTWVAQSMHHGAGGVVGDRLDEDSGVQVSLMNANTGELTDDLVGSSVPAHARWAARVVAALSTGDERAYDRVLNELPVGEAEAAQMVMVTLFLVAGTIKAMPYGYATLGRRR